MLTVNSSITEFQSFIDKIDDFVYSTTRHIGGEDCRFNTTEDRSYFATLGNTVYIQRTYVYQGPISEFRELYIRAAVTENKTVITDVRYFSRKNRTKDQSQISREIEGELYDFLKDFLI